MDKNNSRHTNKTLAFKHSQGHVQRYMQGELKLEGEMLKLEHWQLRLPEEVLTRFTSKKCVLRSIVMFYISSESRGSVKSSLKHI